MAEAARRGAALMRLRRWGFAGLAAFTLILAHVWHSAEYLVLSPGPVADAGRLIAVEGAPPGEGGFVVTAVSVRRAGIPALVRTLLDPAVELRPARSFFPRRLAWAEYAAFLDGMMEESLQAAAGVAMRHAGMRVAARPRLRVAALLPGSVAEGRVRPGDRLLALDGVAVETREEFRVRLGEKEAGDEVRLRLISPGDAAAREVRLPLQKGEEAPLGLYLEEGFEIDLPLAVRRLTQDVGGASAGLMFALEVYDRLTPGRLAAGRRIAGTGVLRLDGAVEPVEGVRQKVIAAEAYGADAFLAPRANLAEAMRAARRIAVYPADTFEQVVRLLERLDGEERPSDSENLTL